MFYFTPYIILPLLSTAVNGLLALYAWQRRHVRAGQLLFWILLGLCGWSLAYVMNVSATLLPVKILGYKTANTFACLVTPLFMFLSVIAVGLDRWLSRRVMIAVCLIPFLSSLGAWTAELHSLHRYDFHMYESGPLLLLDFEAGPLYKLHVGYLVFVDLISIALLTSGFFRFPRSEWPRFGLLILALLIPLTVEVMPITPVKGFAFISSSFFVSGIFFTSAVFLYRLLDLLPLARNALFDQIGEPVLVLDKNQLPIAANASATNLIGHDLLLGLRRRFPSLDSTLRESGSEDNEPDYLEDHLEPQRTWRISASPLKAGVIEGTLVVLHDVTILKRTQEKLLESEDELRTINYSLQQRIDEEVSHRMVQEHLLANNSRMAAMGQMINAIAHQWRQPLSTLSMLIQKVHVMAKRNLLSGEQLDEFKNTALQQIDHMSETIEEFRGFYRPEKQKDAFSPEAHIQSAIRLLERQFAGSAVTIRLTCEESADRSLLGYPNEFKQVILNLLVNARDAIVDCRAASGSPREGLIEIDLSIQNHKDLRIDISDNGCGIAPEIAGSIFDPFFTTKEDKGGSGIGLYISRMIVEDSLRGKIELVDSAHGARFRVEIPVEEAS